MSKELPHREAVERLSLWGYAFLPAADALAALDVGAEQLNALRDTWSRLPRDMYLRDGGRYRSRRHSCFVQDFTSSRRTSFASIPQTASGGPRRRALIGTEWILSL